MTASQDLTTEETCHRQEPATEAEETGESVSQEEETVDTVEQDEDAGEESGDDPEDRAPRKNSAICRCVRAWNRAFDKRLDELRRGAKGDSATAVAKDAFLRQLPPLAGFKNVRDFIACLTYGEAVDILCHYEVVNFLESAKAALSVLRHGDARQALKSRRRGRPKQEEEK